MKKKICVITGSRADYGLLKWLILFLQNDKNIKSTFTKVECYAYKKNSDAPIGGGTGFGTASGTATIRVEVPEKYENKSGLSMKCKIVN